MFWRAQVSIGADTALPSDAAVNVWHFDSDRAEDAGNRVLDSESIVAQLEAFYQEIDEWMPATINGVATVKCYLMSDPFPRVPHLEDTFALTDSGASGLAHELAACLSFKGASVSGVNPRRRRGRVYIGPLTTGALATVDNRRLLSDGFKSDLVTAATNLLAAPGANDPKWAVFSRSEAQGLAVGEPAANEYNYTLVELAAGYTDVTEGWVDNAVDVQRRRGHAATVRTAF